MSLTPFAKKLLTQLWFADKKGSWPRWWDTGGYAIIDRIFDWPGKLTLDMTAEELLPAVQSSQDRASLAHSHYVAQHNSSGFVKMHKAWATCPPTVIAEAFLIVMRQYSEVRAAWLDFI